MAEYPEQIERLSDMFRRLDGIGKKTAMRLAFSVLDMQEDMAALQEDLDAREYDIAAGGGAVSVKINGKLEVSNIVIDPDVVDPDDVETLQDILVAGVNEAIKKVNTTNNEEMGKITGSLNMGGFPGLF